ncbi:MAG: hypothetical protein IIB62_00835 [Proteobacteria bacterium]|nr:hypothetical protein [Pseudomonadota bacterium]
MLVKSTTDWSRAANALLLGALFFPLLPVLSALIQYTLGAALGCQFSSGGACLIAGVDLARSSAHAAGAVNEMVRASAGVALLYYIMLLTVLAQLTSSGFRGRIVRTCAVIMWAGVLPFVLGLAALVLGEGTVQCGTPGDPAIACDAPGALTGFVYYGKVFFHWLADIAVPLAVMVTGLVALTLGYRTLVGRLVRICTPQD